MNNSIKPFISVLPTPTKTKQEVEQKQIQEQNVKQEQTKAQAQVLTRSPEALNNTTANLAVLGKSLVKTKETEEKEDSVFDAGPIYLGDESFESKGELEAFIENPKNKSRYERLTA